MHTCKTCKYWGDGFPTNMNTSNKCGKIELDYPNSKNAAFIEADASDDSGLYATLMTNSNFGCLLHSIKQ